MYETLIDWIYTSCCRILLNDVFFISCVNGNGINTRIKNGFMVNCRVGIFFPIIVEFSRFIYCSKIGEGHERCLRLISMIAGPFTANGNLFIHHLFQLLFFMNINIFIFFFCYVCCMNLKMIFLCMSRQKQ